MNMIRLPDWIQIITETDPEKSEQVYDASVKLSMQDKGLQAILQAEKTAVREVVLCWKKEADGAGKILGDHWERGYGDLEWKTPSAADIMPWYFLDARANECRAYGVKVRPGAMCYWKIIDQDVLLHLDVRCGGKGVVLDGRELLMAEILMEAYQEDDLFHAAKHFCGCMCTDAISAGFPVYGSNNWYYAYGKSSREEMLQDSAYLAAMTEGIENRPFMVIDDGWQVAHTEQYNGGPWNEGNNAYGDMGQLAKDMKTLGVRPGIWFRPLLDRSEEIPAEWRLQSNKEILDISHPEVIRHVQEDMRRIAGWGFELVKHDFSTYDLLGGWGFEIGSKITEDGWSFRDASRTTAELIVSFYQAIYEAAGDMLILGCNCIGHLGAGLMQMNRTGDDTSGVEWARTRKMGVNTLAFRMPQHETFFGADADCVGITDAIPWQKNRQWMQVLALSGTPFFVSVKPGTLSKEQEEELKSAYRTAASNTISSVPLDWKETKLPEHWMTFEGQKNFQW